MGFLAKTWLKFVKWDANALKKRDNLKFKINENIIKYIL
jgi:hypothetical protein